MKITKLGHCCLVIEEGGTIILTDPGAYTTSQTTLSDIDVILITHEHPDHLHIESLQTVLLNNPNVEVITNAAVGAILDKKGIAYTRLEHGQRCEVKGISLEGFGTEHAPIYPSVPPVQNIGYFINDRLFYPGDALYNPKKPIDVLALPVAGPWLTIADAIDYAKILKPKYCFPVHDGMLAGGKLGPVHFLPKRELEKASITFVVLTDGQTAEF